MKRKEKRWRGEKQHSKKQKQNLTPKALFERPLTYFHQTHPRQSSAEVSKFSWCCWNQLCVFPHTITQTHTRGRKYLSLPVFVRSRSRSHTWWMLGALFKSGPRGSGSRGKQDGKGKWREREREQMRRRNSRVVVFFGFCFYAKTITTQPGRSASAAVYRRPGRQCCRSVKTPLSWEFWLLLLPVPTRGALSRKCLNVGRQNDANDCKSRRALSRLSLCECEAALWGYIWFKLFSENVRAHIRCVCHMYWHTLLHIHRHTPCHKQRVLWEEVWERESTSSRQQQQQRCREWQLLTETDMRDHLCTITINTVWLTWLLTDRPAHTSEGHIWGRAKMLPGVFCTVLDTCCNSIGCREVCAVWETICFSVHVKLLFFYGSWHVSTADRIQMIIF